MNLFRTAQTIAAFAYFITAAAAQTTPPPRSGAAAIPKGKIAFINTGDFQEKIGEFRSKVESLNRQFEPRVKEVQTMADRVGALENTIKTQSAVLGAAKVADLTEQLEREKRNYQRKTEDLEADGNRAKEQLLGPIREKLSKFVEGYTEKRGITLLIDLGNAIQSNTVLWYDARLDVTQDFITEYNKANPVTAAAAPAPPKP